MAIRTHNIEGIGIVTFHKRRGASSMRIHINGSNVKVTLPNSIPYRFALSYVQQKKDWINQHLKPAATFRNGDLIGKSHRIEVRKSATRAISTRVRDDVIVANLPLETSTESNQVQEKIKVAIERALKKQTAELIIPRLSDLALENDLEFNSVKIKKLRRRWGSCDSFKNLTLNLFLPQMPWHLIDYVLIHELCHVEEMNHSQAFWKLVESIVPDYRARRKEIKQYAPESYVL